MSEVLKEHYGYLSDAIRQQRFAEALSRVVRPGDRVVDVGCGFGVLGLLCLKAGAAHVWGIDRTAAIEIARETMRRAGLESSYSCIHEDSRRVALPEPVELVICDHVGNFGFDYHIIETMADARRRFLKPGGRVVPERVTMQVAGMRSNALRSLANGWQGEAILPELRWLRDYAVNAKHHYNFVADEVATGQADLGTVDLTADSPDHLRFRAELQVERSGELDGLGGWFSCDIVAGVSMTNSPLAPDQINRCQVFLPFAEPLAAEAGDTVAVSVGLRHQSGLLAWNAKVERTGQSARQSTWNSTVLYPPDLVAAAERIPSLSPAGRARLALLARIDGKTSGTELEAAVLSEHPDLFPSSGEIARFIRSELARSTG